MTVKRLQDFTETVFTTYSRLAVEHDAVNLGQGFPDSDGPPRMLEIAREEIAQGNNQYPPLRGQPVLIDAISQHYNVPNDHITVTAGATEAIAASVLGLVEPGSEVIVIEPYYDAYAAATALAGATRVAVPLKQVGNTWDLDVPAIKGAVTDKTAMVVINSPHNPTGSVFTREALEDLASVCVDNDLLVLADEVYEHLTFGSEHVSIQSLPGMDTRTIKVSSAAKSYACTGWKTGWAIADPKLLEGVLAAKQYLSFVSGSPFQPAVAHALTEEDNWLKDMVTELEECHDILAEGLTKAGYDIFDTNGTYYIVADVHQDADEFCRKLPETKGVAAIPLTAFTDEPEPWHTKVRFAFCKQPDVLKEAVKRLLA